MRRNAPVMIVNWTNEEGSRFAPAMLCSGVYAGVFTPEFAYSAAKTGRASSSAMNWSASATRASTRRAPSNSQAMFELHIEQGPILEAESKMIGVVTGVQGMRWYEVTVRGQESHTGATPMGLRKNALLGASRMIEAIHQVGMAHLPGVASVGLDREPAQQPQRGAGRGVLHGGPAPPGREGSRPDGSGLSGGAAEDRCGT